MEHYGKNIAQYRAFALPALISGLCVLAISYYERSIAPIIVLIAHFHSVIYYPMHRIKYPPSAIFSLAYELPIYWLSGILIITKSVSFYSSRMISGYSRHPVQVLNEQWFFAILYATYLCYAYRIKVLMEGKQLLINQIAQCPLYKSVFQDLLKTFKNSIFFTLKASRYFFLAYIFMMGNSLFRSFASVYGLFASSRFQSDASLAIRVRYHHDFKELFFLLYVGWIVVFNWMLVDLVFSVFFTRVSITLYTTPTRWAFILRKVTSMFPQPLIEFFHHTEESVLDLVNQLENPNGIIRKWSMVKLEQISEFDYSRRSDIYSRPEIWERLFTYSLAMVKSYALEMKRAANISRPNAPHIAPLSTHHNNGPSKQSDSDNFFGLKSNKPSIGQTEIAYHQPAEFGRSSDTSYAKELPDIFLSPKRRLEKQSELRQRTMRIKTEANSGFNATPKTREQIDEQTMDSVDKVLAFIRSKIPKSVVDLFNFYDGETTDIDALFILIDTLIHITHRAVKEDLDNIVRKDVPNLVQKFNILIESLEKSKKILIEERSRFYKPGINRGNEISVVISMLKRAVCVIERDYGWYLASFPMSSSSLEFNTEE